MSTELGAVPRGLSVAGLSPMEELNAQTARPSRGFGWGLLLLSIAAAVVGATQVVKADGWWDYATAIVAFAGAVVLAYVGTKAASTRG